MLTAISPPHDAKHYFVWLSLKQGANFIRVTDSDEVKEAKRLFVALSEAKVDYNNETAIQLYTYIEDLIAKEKSGAREKALKAATAFLSGNIEETKQNEPADDPN